jgi:hypothetical protein
MEINKVVGAMSDASMKREMPVTVSVTLTPHTPAAEYDLGEAKADHCGSSSVGRPREVEGQPRSSSVNVKLTALEKAELDSKAAGVPLSSYIRSVLMEAGVI